MQPTEKKGSCSSSSEGSSPCPVCLEPIKEEAYLDRCFHTFCYRCIVHWARYVASQHSQSISSIKCPLCKGENFSIIHGFSGNLFQRHYVNQDPESSYLSRAHKYRWQCYDSDSGITCHKFNALRYWKCSRYLQYNSWLQSWLKREIQTLTQEEDVDIIVHHILGVIESFLKRQQQHFKIMPEQKRAEFKGLLSDASRPFVLGRTERFVDELELFLASGLNMEAYDKVYMQCLGMSTSGTASEYATEIHDQVLQAPKFYFVDEDMDKAD